MDEGAFGRWFNEVKAKYKNATLGVSLWHHHEDGRGDQLDSWNVPDQFDVESIWPSIQDVARNYAELLRGSQTFAVVVTANESRVSRRGFTLEGGAIAAQKVAAANSEGAVVGELLRHLENKERIQAKLLDSILGGLTGEIERLGKRNTHLEMRDIERAEGYERLLSKQHERELATKKHLHNTQMTNELVNGVRMVIPTIANKIAGEKVLPQGPLTPTEQALQALLESITPEQMTKIQGALRPEQAMTVMETYNALVLRKGPANAAP
jgi:hypothetical protein